MVYDGVTIPFNDLQFDWVLIAYVLHHANDPDSILAEAAGVGKRVMVLEDVVTGRFHHWVTSVLDSIMNLEFFNHPHHNRTDAEWERSFKRVGMNVRQKELKPATMGIALPILHGIYVLEHEHA